MKIGLFSNGNRNNALAKTSYDDDLHEIILADRLGISEAWISEHGTFLAYQRPDQLPSADLFICKAAALTKQIRMGPGIRPLPFFHPLQVATECAVCDHLTNGRYIAGFGVGINCGDSGSSLRTTCTSDAAANGGGASFGDCGDCWGGSSWNLSRGL